MKDNIVLLGPWNNNSDVEWLVTKYDSITSENVTVTVDGEKITYPIHSEFVTLPRGAKGKKEKLIDKFIESDYMLMMEVKETNSGSIRVSGV